MALVCKLRDVSAPVLVLPSFADVRQGGASFTCSYEGGQKDFSVWIASKKMPTEWREREDLAWWTNALAKTHEREMQELAVENVSIQQQLDAFASQWQADVTVYRTTQEIDDYYSRLGMLRVK